MPEPGRSPKLEGIDFKRAAIEYPSRLSTERLDYLRTKPFYNVAHKPPKHRGPGIDMETHRHFCDFANMAAALDLPAGARILEVACGSGWLSEFFARLGYDVTGIDISPQLIQICEERIRALPPLIDHETPICCRFWVHDIELAPLTEKFDAIVCYDALHHFEDAMAALRNIAKMLPVGGVLFILEGNRPPSGSRAEEELAAVMREFGTLESPFDPAYLHRLVDEVGLAIIGDYVSINGLFDREAVDEKGRIRVSIPPINYLLCKKVSETGAASTVPDSREPGLLRADINLDSTWPEKIGPGKIFDAKLKVTNTGDTLWLGGNYIRRGGVTLGVKIMNGAGDVIDEFHGEPALPRGLAPNECCAVVIERAAPAEPGPYILKIDLVDQHISWFEERGSKPLVLPLRVG
ncbi:MAG: class I SAM-dependent methyltransferase [Chthoniobacterales bacterium]